MRTISRRQFITVTTAGVAGAYVAAACGGDDDGESDATSTAAPAGAPRAGASPTVAAGSDNGAAGLRWFGQAMFLLTSPGGTSVLLDPFGNIGYTVPPPLDTDAAAMSHEHPDHNNGALGGTTAQVLRGLTADGWADIDETVGDVRIRTVRTFHDDTQGTQRGRNAAFLLETAGLRFAHLGDLGHTLDDTQVSAIGAVDVLMVPVGGIFTIDGAGASEVARQVGAKIAFPMHYKTAKAGAALADAEAFLAGKSVQRVGDTTIRIVAADLPDELTAYVLDFE
jgi:L-ascorbate metabolism protein UlaG (beta-lactamase superfamily)